MKCPKCFNPLQKLQRRCNRCAIRVAYCKKCNKMNALEDQACDTCGTQVPIAKNFQQLEADYYQKRFNQAIRFVCICGKLISVSLDQAGKTGKCPKCAYRLLVPDPKQKKEEKEQEVFSAEDLFSSPTPTNSNKQDESLDEVGEFISPVVPPSSNETDKKNKPKVSLRQPNKPKKNK